MREFKFEAINKVTKQKINADILIFNDGHFYADFREFEDGIPLDRNEWAVREFTGLKDENNRHIFEGDIVKVYELNDYHEHEFVSAVTFEESNFFVTDQDDCEWPLYVFHHPENAISSLREITIIGNVYEHPERLEDSP